MKILLGYRELRKNLEIAFKKAGITEFADIDWIMVEVTGKSRSMLQFVEQFSSDEMSKIMNAVEKRLKHIPLGYIFGKSYFFGREFKVDENVLIPRQDTEILIEKICDDIKSKKENVSVLDIGTGSGAIAITIQKETGANVVAVDVSDGALEIAKHNANKLEADVEFVKSNLFENVKGQFDFIVSNPPYIESSVIETLDDEVKLNEPILALDGGEDGLDFYRKIVEQSPKYLNKGGKLYFEIGYNQADALKQLMKDKFKNVCVYKDYGNNDRVVVGEIYD
ncbi:MAG: peptide chain release factor N(5)-glutamine methyltransferase [Clostridia bacterium]|nr:peptide chain release factor N(5)-glutamine methyltransferase [Clostridia bacterium]